MNLARLPLLLPALALGLAAADARGAVVYKLTDRDGRVTYVDRLPKSHEGEVQRLDIDTSRSVRVLPAEPSATQRALRRYEEIVAERTAAEAARDDARVRQARARVAAARAALAAAQEGSTAEDWIYFGPGRGRAPRPEYQARLERLESDLGRAEEALREAERG